MAPISIKSSKRRVIETKQRKKALFSCDRCKTKKIGCQRLSKNSDKLDVDVSVECLACKKSGSECKTTIERKKRKHSPIENVGLHYQCLLKLVEGIFPEKDVNNIDILIQLGISLGVEMPPRNGEEDVKEKLNSIPSASNFKIQEYSYTNITQLEEFKSAQQKIEQSDCFVIDQDNTPHYVGPMGAMNFLASTVDVMVFEQNSVSLWESYQLVYNNDTIISSKQATVNENILQEMIFYNFPFLNCIGRAESDFYVTEFFDKIHPYCFCYDFTIFKTKYESFWKVLTGITSREESCLSNGFICSVYMTWILAKTLDTHHGEKKLKPSIIERLLGIIKICLSEMLLTPSLDGIRCMLMLALYLDTNCRRESGYLLLELSCHQAIAIGLSRESVMESCPDKNLAVSMRRTFWTLFQHESRISNQFGRNSSFNISEISSAYPKILNIDDKEYNHLFIENIKLSKILNQILEFRSTISTFDKLLIENNIIQVFGFKKQYDLWYDELHDQFKILDDDYMGYKFHLLTQFHYYYISLLFPYLLHSCQERTSLNNSSVKDLVSACLESAMEVSKMLNYSKNSLFYYNMFNTDIFLAYYATMSLVLGFVVLQNHRNKVIGLLDDNFENIDNIKESMNKIKIFNNECQGKIKGSLKKISKFINVLLGGFQTDNEKYYYHKDTFNLSNSSPLFRSPSLFPLDPEIASEFFLKSISQSNFSENFSIDNGYVKD